MKRIVDVSTNFKGWRLLIASPFFVVMGFLLIIKTCVILLPRLTRRSLHRLLSGILKVVGAVNLNGLTIF